jgi:hypothetical protein
MAILLYQVAGTVQKWAILCPEEKKGVLMQKVGLIKEAAAEVLWIRWEHLLNQLSSGGGTS